MFSLKESTTDLSKIVHDRRGVRDGADAGSWHAAPWARKHARGIVLHEYCTKARSPQCTVVEGCMESIPAHFAWSRDLYRSAAGTFTVNASQRHFHVHIPFAPTAPLQQYIRAQSIRHEI